MQLKYRLFCRRSGIYYLEDRESRHQESLKTKCKGQAERLLHARNEAHQNPISNLQMARAYLKAADPEICKRTWQDAFEELVKSKGGSSTCSRWHRAIKAPSFDLIRKMSIIETRAEHFLRVLASGPVSTNVYLRRLHNFALDMNWLPCPVLPRRQWPPVRFKEKRAITSEEHQKIVQREQNLERRAFYEMLWYLGASQSDMANLGTENIDWTDKTISFERQKLRHKGQQPALISFSPEVESILRALPGRGPLFPYLITVRGCDRATEFKQRCRGLGIEGITLHSYRYAWAERAKQCGLPERFAQQALGHGSKAVHRAYSRKALVKVPSLEVWAQAHAEQKVIQVEFPGPEQPERDTSQDPQSANLKN
ncbi:MAG: Phage integrase family protein [Pedosphaera sp.]|nr:Phage integrase family protein [Pedosphaera sp.]